MSEAIGRNDPCPCGSGKKYKNCCAGKTRWTRARVAGMPLPAMAALLGGIVAVIVFVAFFGPNARRAAAPSSAGVPLSAVPTGPTPEPWAYDSTTNKHWDPAHGHWHDGPPPAEAARGTASGAAPGLIPGTGAAGAAGATPAPYQYDPATNRHWDPAHGHWHDGPPPATPTR